MVIGQNPRSLYIPAVNNLPEECKEMEKVLLENNGNTAGHIPGPLPLREFVSS